MEKVIREITSKAQAKKIAREIVEDARAVEKFNQEVAELAKERGIDVLKDGIPVKNQRILNFMQKESMGKLDLDGDGYVNFIQATGERVWIATKADMPADAPATAKSLLSIIGKELFRAATRRTVDPKKLQDLVDAGEITEEDIAPAYFVRKKAPYIRFYKGEE